MEVLADFTAGMSAIASKTTGVCLATSSGDSSDDEFLGDVALKSLSEEEAGAGRALASLSESEEGSSMLQESLKAVEGGDVQPAQMVSEAMPKGRVKSTAAIAKASSDSSTNNSDGSQSISGVGMHSVREVQGAVSGKTSVPEDRRSSSSSSSSSSSMPSSDSAGEGCFEGVCQEEMAPHELGSRAIFAGSIGGTGGESEGIGRGNAQAIISEAAPLPVAGAPAPPQIIISSSSSSSSSSGGGGGNSGGSNSMQVPSGEQRRMQRHNRRTALRLIDFLMLGMMCCVTLVAVAHLAAEVGTAPTESGGWASAGLSCILGGTCPEAAVRFEVPNTADPAFPTKLHVQSLFPKSMSGKLRGRRTVLAVHSRQQGIGWICNTICTCLGL
eukprot:1153871-Pelagomonas_calceolata.AAC.3